MYTPRSFREDDGTRIHSVIRRHNFGVLFTQHDGHPYATHLPFLVDSDRGEHGTLVAHLARANPHSKILAHDTESLVTFLGPHSYISPAWYEEQVTVPTWNYVAVHARGRVRVVDDHNELEAMVRRLVDYHEAAEGRPWDTSQMEEVMQKELKGIVGFEMPIARLDAKFKLSQGRSSADQERMIRKLEESDDPDRHAVAALMRRNIEEEKI